MQKSILSKISVLFRFFFAPLLLYMPALRAEYLRMKGYYKFKFSYFGKWERIKLERYSKHHLGDTHKVDIYKTRLMGACILEYNALKTFFTNEFKDQVPEKIIDFGCGLARSSVFFMHMFNWHSAKFFLVDGNANVFQLSNNQRLFHQDINLMFEKGETFYTDFDLLDRFATSNKMQNFELVDLNTHRQRLSQIKNVNLLYSFYSIGYHWDILPTLDFYGIHDLLKTDAFLIFGIRPKRDPLRKEVNTDSLLQRGYKQVALIEGMAQDLLILKKLSDARV